ncbi:MAG TPA: hypothetical protein VNV42_01115 [Solirubrobacteraceae bacterium]|nr:hypothetical protein [Solirubrobacteraceae bacterium]
MLDTTAPVESPGTESPGTESPVAASPVEGPAPAGMAGSHGMPDGPNQGVIEEARRRQRQRRVRGVLGGLAALAGVGALVAALGAGGDPAPGSRHTIPAPRADVARAAASGAGFAIRLSPSLDGGQEGWCVAVEEPAGAGIAGGGCGMLPVRSTPIAFQVSGGSARTRKESIVAITTPQVAAVMVDGKRLPTVVPTGLLYGLRAVRIVMPLAVHRSRHGRLGVSVPAEPTLTPLDAQGRPIAQHVLRKPGSPAAPHAPGDAGRPPCSLRAQGLAGVAAQWSHVAGAVRPYPGALVGRAYVSCVDVEYSLDHWPLDAAILLDAAHPGARPAAIPGLRSVAGEPAYNNGEGDFKGDVTATRIPHAWLVVAGGRSLRQRIVLLRHLAAAVTLPAG